MGPIVLAYSTSHKVHRYIKNDGLIVNKDILLYHNPSVNAEICGQRSD